MNNFIDRLLQLQPPDGVDLYRRHIRFLPGLRFSYERGLLLLPLALAISCGGGSGSSPTSAPNDLIVRTETGVIMTGQFAGNTHIEDKAMDIEMVGDVNFPIDAELVIKSKTLSVSDNLRVNGILRVKS